jgi:hypothetical protein
MSCRGRDVLPTPFIAKIGLAKSKLRCGRGDCSFDKSLIACFYCDIYQRDASNKAPSGLPLKRRARVWLLFVVIIASVATHPALARALIGRDLIAPHRQVMIAVGMCLPLAHPAKRFGLDTSVFFVPPATLSSSSSLNSTGLRCTDEASFKISIMLFVSIYVSIQNQGADPLDRQSVPERSRVP